MITKLILAATGVAAAVALAPNAAADAADLTNTDVVSGNQVQSLLLLPTPTGAFDGYADGNNISKPPSYRVDGSGNRVYGTWINNDTEFVPNPAGTQQQYTVGGNTQKHPYKTGCPHC